ncbi:hypothetical protein ACWD25_31370, partial [Streptomyces sp. NPDC002920]
SGRGRGHRLPRPDARPGHPAHGTPRARLAEGSPVAKALLDYVGIGCDLLSIRGYDPLNDAVDYARHVLPLVRQELAHRAATTHAA